MILENDPLRMSVINADGSSAAMCGNGLRCCMLLARRLNLANPRQKIATGGGVIEVVETAKDPFACGFSLPIQALEEHRCAVAGTPHQVVFGPPDEKQAKQFQKAASVNVDFVEISDSRSLCITTWERGVGWTKACGTGTCAGVWTAWQCGRCESSVTVRYENGSVFCTAAKDSVWIEGSAQLIYEGVIDLDW